MEPESVQLSPPYQLILDGLNHRMVIPFLGAGASQSRAHLNANDNKNSNIFIPTALELANYLARKSEFPNDEGVDLAKVAQYYNLVGGRAPLHRELHNIFNRDFPIAPLHNFLASIDTPLLIITTNYDDLIERAFVRHNRQFDVVVHASDPRIGDRLLWFEYGTDTPREISPNRLDINLEKKTVIYKMHGAVDRQSADRDQYVITEDDYIDFIVRMTKNKAVPAIFAELFQSSHFLFLGYSLRDWNLRVILNRIQRDGRRPSDIISWGIQHRPSRLERKFWQKRGVEVYDMPLDDFVNELLLRSKGKV